MLLVLDLSSVDDRGGWSPVLCWQTVPDVSFQMCPGTQGPRLHMFVIKRENYKLSSTEVVPLSFPPAM